MKFYPLRLRLEYLILVPSGYTEPDLQNGSKMRSFRENDKLNTSEKKSHLSSLFLWGFWWGVRVLGGEQQKDQLLHLCRTAESRKHSNPRRCFWCQANTT